MGHEVNKDKEIIAFLLPKVEGNRMRVYILII